MVDFSCMKQKQAMKNIRILLVLSVFCQFVHLSPSIAEGAGAGWRINQEGETGGPHRTIFTKDGISCENLKAGVVIASKAPLWDVVVCNKKTKTYCVIPYSKFHGEMSSKLFDSDRIELKDAKWRFDGTTSHLGYELYRYKMISVPNVKARKYASPFIAKATYWTFKSIEAPKQAQELLSKIFQLPPQVKGLPFRLLFTDVTRGWFENLNTLSIEKVNGTLVSFDAPKGYILKKTQEEVMVDPVSRDVFNGFMKWSEPKIDKKK